MYTHFGYNPAILRVKNGTINQNYMRRYDVVNTIK